MPISVIQKLVPSLHAPNGMLPLPVEKLPIGVRSAAFQSDTLAVFIGHENPLPVKRRLQRGAQAVA